MRRFLLCGKEKRRALIEGKVLSLLRRCSLLSKPPATFVTQKRQKKEQ